MGKFRDYCVFSFILIVSFLFLIGSNLGYTLLFLTIASGTLGGVLFCFTNDTSIPRKLIYLSEISLPLMLGNFWGMKAFFVGAAISGVAALILYIRSDEFRKSGKKMASHSGEILKTTRATFQEKTPYFSGKGTSIQVGQHIVSDPLTYVVDSKKYPNFDASLLCLRRRVELPSSEYIQSLPYWPQLSELNAYQLGLYLDWLASGRKDPEIELGYVFIYFYGLERRALVERKDILDIAQEVLRLLEIYNYSRSFTQYATGLLIHLILLGILQPKIKLLNKLIELQSGRIDDKLEMIILGHLANVQKPLPAKWALLLAKQDERSKNSVVFKRAYEEFAKLFALRYNQKLINKMCPRLDERQKTIGYHPASPALLYATDYSTTIDNAQWTTVKGWRRQFSAAIKLFDNCIDELKAYSRNIQSPTSDMSISFEALPKELRDEVDHPKQKEWDRLLDLNVPSDNGMCLLSIGGIAELREIDYRERLTLGQSKSIVSFVESLGASLEPDARYTQKSYLWNEKVGILRLPDEPLLPQGQNYALISMLMPLAIEVSLASGSLEEEEKTVIIDFFQERFMPNRNECLRQGALMECLLCNGVSLTGLKNRITQRFNDKQRQAIGKFLVMIAGAADGVCIEEVKSLTKSFKSLGLEKALVNTFIDELGFEHPEKSKLKIKGIAEQVGEKIPRQAPKALDIEKIRKIREDSIEATTILLKAMEQTDQDDDLEERCENSINMTGKMTPTPDTQLSKETSDRNVVGISKHIVPFYNAIIKRESWTEKELRDIALRCKVTTSAAIEDINSWADEHLGDLLIEEGDPVIVNVELLK